MELTFSFWQGPWSKNLSASTKTRFTVEIKEMKPPQPVGPRRIPLPAVFLYCIIAEEYTQSICFNF